MEPLIKDKRPIRSIWWGEGSGDGDTIEVGTCGVTRIVPYLEDGEMAPVAWLAVYCAGKDDLNGAKGTLAIGDELRHRIPARNVSISY